MKQMGLGGLELLIVLETLECFGEDDIGYADRIFSLDHFMEGPCSRTLYPVEKIDPSRSIN
jgi:hypothetical protein